ncbi:hypothetical protein [Hoeflea sp. EC-HK425]|uniref:hypothetical protein n=1 Tax=Hoeflea sp. EC-HK425 TaxID=2038388 RepID=UPI001258B625|nr:hypothetical protein [Hoeflea sp. EC-HK425]VVT34692.1 conserved membrane hypothetical protein [Hoeflea sp. EC-HK425]
MPSRLTARSFTGWFILFVSLLALGTVFFGQALWFVVPVIAGQGCISGGTCGAMAAVFGLWLQPGLLIAASVVGAMAFYGRGLAVGSRLWTLFPLALLMPYLPSLFMLGNLWGVNIGSLFLFFPRWSLFELMPLMTLGVLLCFQVEYTPGFAGSIARTRLYGSIPIGVIYVGSCVWVCSDLLLSLSPNLGLPVAVAQDIRDLLFFPLSVADGEVFAGLPPGGVRPDLVVPLGTVINLVAFLVLSYALALDSSGRLRRTSALVLIDLIDKNGDNREKPMFRPGRRFDE